MNTRTYVLGIGTVVMLLFAISTNAADKYWSGSGIWDTASFNWGTAPGGPYTTAKWVDGDNAFFEGNAGTVTLGEPINVSNVTISNTFVFCDHILNFATGSTINIQIPGWDGPTIKCGITGSPDIVDNTGYAGQAYFANSYLAPTNSTMTIGTVTPIGGASLHFGGTTTGNSFAAKPNGGGRVYKEGSGTWTVDGVCKFGYMHINGGTFISNGQLYTDYRYLEINNGGTFVINGTFDPRNDYDIRFYSGGTMKGSGTFVGPTTAPLTVQNGAVLAPGDPTGTLTITNADCSIEGTLVIVVDGAQNSALAVDGNLNISAGTSKLEIDASGALEDEYVIATYATLTGSAFGSVNLPASWSIHYGTNAIALSTIPSVDTTPPSINHNATSPADDEFGESPKASLVATFDEAISLKGGGTITIIDTDDGTGTRTIDLSDASQASVEGNELTLSPATELELDTRYEIVIDAHAIEDQAGNPYPGTAAGEWNFSTCRDLENVLICWVRLADAEPYKPINDVLFHLFDNPLLNVDRAFRVASYGLMALNLGDDSGMAPTVEIDYPDAVAAETIPNELRSRARADLVAMGYNLDNYRFILYLIPRECQWKGAAMAFATVGGQEAVFREYPADTIMHEMAHLLGGQHGHQNPSGVLAGGRINLAADKKLHFGMMDAFPGTVENLTSTTPSSTSLTLVPLSISHPTVMPGTRIVNIAEPDNTSYVISYQVSESPYSRLENPELNSKKVFINDDEFNTYSTVRAILGAGEVYTNGYLTVSCDSVAADGLSAEVTINILSPIVTFNPVTASASEGLTGTGSVSLSWADLEPVVVEPVLAYSPSTAQEGVDYTYTPEELIFAPGETNKSFTFNILDDDLIESHETIEFSPALSVTPSSASTQT